MRSRNPAFDLLLGPQSSVAVVNCQLSVDLPPDVVPYFLFAGHRLTRIMHEVSIGMTA